MGADSKIEWTTHTFNPWVGCTKVSAACDHCYAENWAKRSGHPELWNGSRRRTSADNWKQPIKWNRAAQAAGERHRVFCASLADVFDNQVPIEWRYDLGDLITKTPSLDWLLLTKRPQNIERLVPGPFPPNVWLGITAENQEEYDRRWPILAKIPAVVRFVSYEPALGLVYLRKPYPDWVICGGESGGHARHEKEFPVWASHMQYQCADSAVAFFFKQMVKKAPIPEHLLVRQFPTPRAA